MSGAAAAATANGVIPQFVDIVDVNLHDFKVAPTMAVVTYTLNSDGTRNFGNWLLIGTNTDYECRATITSGGLTGGDSTGAWLSLGTTRMWYVHATNTVVTCTLTIEIRRASDGVVLDTATVTLDAESTP
jgi:hypothetical protein